MGKGTDADVRQHLNVFCAWQAYVAFADASGAAAAKAAIHGRLFAGITVQATFLTIEQFNAAGGTLA